MITPSLIHVAQPEPGFFQILKSLWYQLVDEPRIFSAQSHRVCSTHTLPAGVKQNAASAHKPAPARPLRVLCVQQAGARPGHGQLRISGRMADVCAELERLATAEAQTAKPIRHAVS